MAQANQSCAALAARLSAPNGPAAWSPPAAGVRFAVGAGRDVAVTLLLRRGLLLFQVHPAYRPPQPGQERHRLSAAADVSLTAATYGVCSKAQSSSSARGAGTASVYGARHVCHAGIENVAKFTFRANLRRWRPLQPRSAGAAVASPAARCRQGSSPAAAASRWRLPSQ